MNINITIQWWEIALAFPFCMLYGFIYYATIINTWKGMQWFVWIPNLPVVLMFGLIDTIFNIIFGSVLFFELPLINGITFSQRLCHWYEQGRAGWRFEQAKWWASILNEISPNHIS